MNNQIGDPAPEPKSQEEQLLIAVLPGKPRPPKKHLEGGVFWLYGDMKIGKTTLASRFDGVWFLATEKGQDFVKCREPTVITSWAGFVKLVHVLCTTKPEKFADGEPIKWIAIDVYGDLYRMCMEHTNHSLGVEDPSELGHGKGWSRLRNHFFQTMNRLRRETPYGIILIDHRRITQFEAAGKKQNRIEPSVGAAGYDWAKKNADLIAYAAITQVAERVDGQPTGNILEKRVLYTHPNISLVAGGRFHEALPAVIDLSSDLVLDKLQNRELKEEKLQSDSLEEANIRAPTVDGEAASELG
jgi:hypothetical protein